MVAVNKPLLEAYNAMWDAQTELETGEPERALPHDAPCARRHQKARRPSDCICAAAAAGRVDLAKVRSRERMTPRASKRPVAP